MTKNKKILLALFLVLGVITFYFAQKYLTLESLQVHREAFRQLYLDHQFIFMAVFSGLYVLNCALSLPFATLLSLTSPWIFGLFNAFIIVSVSSTIGALMATIVVRYFLYDYFLNKYKGQYQKFISNFKSNETSYLVSLRLIPFFPFFLVNILIGLTKMNLFKYGIISFFSMMPGTALYLIAANEVTNIESLDALLDSQVMVALLMLGILTFLPSLLRQK